MPAANAKPSGSQFPIPDTSDVELPDALSTWPTAVLAPVPTANPPARAAMIAAAAAPIGRAEERNDIGLATSVWLSTFLSPLIQDNFVVSVRCGGFPCHAGIQHFLYTGPLSNQMRQCGIQMQPSPLVKTRIRIALTRNRPLNSMYTKPNQGRMGLC